MKPADDKPIPAVSDAVGRAAALCDPEVKDRAVTELAERFEDDSRPATAVEDLDGELRRVAREVDPEDDSPAVEIATASAVWLATNMDSADDRERVLRESVRLRFGSELPGQVAEWLRAEGLALR